MYLFMCVNHASGDLVKRIMLNYVILHLILQRQNYNMLHDDVPR